MGKKEKSSVPSVGSWSAPVIVRFREDMNSLFNGFFTDFLDWDWHFYAKSFNDIQPNVSFPKVNVRENNDEYTVEIAVAGFDKDDVKLVLKDNCLSISADKKEDNSEGSDKYLKREISSRSFSRMIRFPNEIDNEDIKADYKDGVIKVIMSKKIKEKKDEEVKIDIN